MQRVCMFVTCQYAEGVLEMGGDKNGVVNPLVNQLHVVFMHPGMLTHLATLAPIIVQLVMFGGLVRRGIRLEQLVIISVFISNLETNNDI